MFWWAKELLSSLRFIAISGDKSFFKSKRMYEVILPAIITCLIFFIYLKFPKVYSPDFLSKISSYIFQFMVFVVPFHLAALGAFATFDRPGLDETLQGTNAQVKYWSNKDNGYFYQTLTLRQYTSLLFGYLCTIGVIYIVLYIISSNIDFRYIFGSKYNFAYDSAIFLVLIFISHYALLSIYAITFLFDKINRIGS